MCLAFRGESSAFPNLTLRKIPAHFAARCEWGRDDYDLPSGLANS
jgi:adenine-specific DNA-methyltransferase